MHDCVALSAIKKPSPGQASSRPSRRATPNGDHTLVAARWAPHDLRARSTMRKQARHFMIIEICYPKRRADTKRNPGVAPPRSHL